MIAEPDYRKIFQQVYKNQQELLATVLTHSECVARKAVDIAEKKFPDLNLTFIYEAAMLHDVGVIRCHAPSIQCFGTLPYICHGVEGRKILDGLGLPPEYGLVCERHTGAGLSKKEIIAKGLPLQLRDMEPVSIEEKIICYADCFFSKSRDLKKEKTLEEVESQMKKHGDESFDKFMALHKLLSL